MEPPYRSGAAATKSPLAAPLPASLALQEALQIGETVCRDAYLAPDGGTEWFGLNYEAAAQRYRVGPLNGDLFNGQAGLAIFVSALAQASGSEQFYAYAHKAAASLRGYVPTFEHALRVERSLE